ncbi:MAG: S-layer homology domain-containing protein, partial [Gorillibacterium sp.]|nr:S-layer homology domain-containing protein [Gorillibacterium sp.]
MKSKNRWTTVGMTFVLAATMITINGTEAKAVDNASVSAGTSAIFKDIDKHWARQAIENAVEKKFVSGYADGTFLPNKSGTRAEFTSMLVQALGLEVEEKQANDKWYVPCVTAANQAGITAADEFKGNWNANMTRQEMARMASRAIGEVNTDPKKWMYLVTKAGIMSGYGGGELGVDKTTTRAESVVVIERTLQVKAGAKLKADKYAVQAAEIYWHKTNIYTVMPDFFNTEYKDGIWDVKKMELKTPDGKFYGIIDEVIAIDLADPNDPNLSKVPHYKELKWDNLKRPITGISIYKHTDSYLLYYRSHVVYNKDTFKYGDRMWLSFMGTIWPNVNG